MTSAHINAEIFNCAPALFDSVRSSVMEHATVADSPSNHDCNKAKLSAAVDRILNNAIRTEQDHRSLWQLLWQRIVYAGTRSAKAGNEIRSMKALVPLFQDLDHYVEGRYVFDKAEWQEFVEIWKARLKPDSQASKWLDLSKSAADWSPGIYFAKAKTSPAVWKLLTKDSVEYPGLRFSVHPNKVEKYFELARFLHEHRTAGNQSPLDYYFGGHSFANEHVTGQCWIEERRLLNEVRKRFSAQVGELTALHTMMDLGLKTIKPDRVMTYLFSQLGWLQTLPASTAKEEVMKVYGRDEVIEEMTVRADVFAAALDRAGHAQAHRLLDIWLVKFGQEPEPDFGITVNLQANGNGIRALLNRQTGKFGSGISVDDAARMWPTPEFTEISRPAATRKKSSRAQQKP